MSGSITHPVPQAFPAFTCPTMFADGVLNVSIAQGVVKHYMYRFEPSFQGDNQFQTQPVAQVVMPTEGFVSSVLYFSLQIEHLIKNDLITRERVEELRKIVEDAAV